MTISGQAEQSRKITPGERSEFFAEDARIFEAVPNELIRARIMSAIDTQKIRMSFIVLLDSFSIFPRRSLSSVEYEAFIESFWMIP